MRTEHSTADPALPTAAPNSPCLTSVKPKSNTKEVDLDELRLLRQIVEEAKSFRRPDKREHHDGEK